MKKITVLMLCLVMAVMCFGCGEDKKSGDEGTSEETFKTGDCSDNTYSNSFFDLKITTPDGWEFMTREQIQQAGSVAEEIFDNAELNLDSFDNFIDMMAQDKQTFSNVSVIYEKSNVALKVYVALAKKQVESLSTDACTFQIVNESTVTLADNEYTLLEVSADYSGIDLKEYIFIRKESGVFCSVTFTVVGDAYSVDEIQSFFG